MLPRQQLLVEANHRQLTESPPQLAVLPWGATEAHNRHLPYGTDVILAERVAERAAEIAAERSARLVVLPAIPFGSNQQQLDQACTISFTTATMLSIVRDVARSLASQTIDRLVILNSHGGNQFQPIVRDVQAEFSVLIVVVNYYQMLPHVKQQLFEAPGDHADEFETSLMLHLCPELVRLAEAGSGKRVPFELSSLAQPGVWTPRPWSKSHPDTGSGDPSLAAAQKGAEFFQMVTGALAEMFVELANARKGQLPYV